MHSAQDTWTVARQVPFFPSASGGKLHAAWAGTHTAVCGRPAALHPVAWIYTAEGERSADVHPMVCRRCLRLTTTAGVSAAGVTR